MDEYILKLYDGKNLINSVKPYFEKFHLTYFMNTKYYINGYYGSNGWMNNLEYFKDLEPEQISHITSGKKV